MGLVFSRVKGQGASRKTRKIVGATARADCSYGFSQPLVAVPVRLRANEQNDPTAAEIVRSMALYCHSEQLCAETFVAPPAGAPEKCCINSVDQEYLFEGACSEVQCSEFEEARSESSLKFLSCCTMSRNISYFLSFTPGTLPAQFHDHRHRYGRNGVHQHLG